MQTIPITITNRIASVPCGTCIVADNPDGYQLSFAFDGEWSEYPLKTARFLVGGEYTDVDFTGSTVMIPSMPSTAYSISVGVYAGEIATSTPAKINVMPSIMATAEGATEYNPAEPSVLPDIDELALDDTFVITDVSEGEKARANIGQIVDYVQSASEIHASDADPLMDEETANPGTSDEYARGDHVHPADPTILHSDDDVVHIYIMQSTIPMVSVWACDKTAEQIKAIIGSQQKYVVEDNRYGALWETVYFNPDASSEYDDLVVFEAVVTDGEENVVRVAFGANMVGEYSSTSLYSKPANGISSNDLDEDVNRSLDHADNAVRFNKQLLTTEQQTQARSNIGAASLSDIGTVFTIKGEVTNVSDLPATGNTVGDVYYVSSVQAGYVWLETTDHPNGYWEELGEPIDLSAYAPIDSPALTGTPTAPTASSSTNTTQIATTAFVKSVLPSVPSASSATPKALGTASAGSSSDYSRADHVHAKPTAAGVGAIAAPASPSTGDTLVYNGSAWVAQNPNPEVTVSSTGAVTQALDACKIYHFTGAITALTITLNAASGTPAQYHFDFTEGSTAFDPTLPSGVVLPDGHTWEADTHYEVDILNNYACVVGWAVTT